jgi:hypothetical protein
METIFVTIAFMAVLMMMMAVGVLFNRPPLKGSCGGVGGNCPCAESGTPGACKTELGEGTQAEMSATEGEDGLIHYS